MAISHSAPDYFDGIKIPKRIDTVARTAGFDNNDGKSVN
jgi:hypothetical protein